MLRYGERIRAFDDFERGLLRERDRVFAQFEKRRREQVIDAVKALDTARMPLLPTGE